MRWILYILIFLALLVLAGFLFPREVALERSVYISRPPQAVFPYINNLHNFNQWSPWYQLDPNTEYRFSGAEEGVGATMSWHSDNPNVGSGTLGIASSEPYSLVRTELNFGDRGMAHAEFHLKPQGSGSNVTWQFTTDMGPGPVSRWMGLLVKKMIGRSYERGLAKLKDVVESSAAAPENIDEGSDTELPPDDSDTMEPDSEEMEPDTGEMPPPGMMDNRMLEESEESIEERQ